MKKNHTKYQETWYVLNRLTHMTSDEMVADVVVPRDSPWFCGHFPEDPVLPGIAQLGIVFDMITYQKQFRLVNMKRVRFKKIIRPDDILKISLSSVPISEREDVSENNKENPLRSCSFKIMTEGEIACSGIFIIIEEKKE
jgi:3-hydroxymyristoyl/3-hydroxydecanoyl-(acyl carrier protein) dehydratase